MLKVRLGVKRGPDSLRPLTEKEIQQKLYGSYQEEPALKEKINTEFLDPLRKESSLGPETKSKNNQSARFPWKEAGSAFVTLAQSVWGILKRITGRKTMGWVALGTVAASLFLSVNALNLYRTEAMKNPKPPSRVVTPREESTLLRPSPKRAERPSALPIESAPAQGQEVPERVSEPAPVAPPAEKVFVVQVATYARETDGERVVKQMIEAGLPAFGKPLRRTSGKTFHLVFLGPFKTFEDAQAELKKFRALPASQNFPDSFVRSL
ncbi:MAG: SPOR domain-containing protein [Candidatus Omnitrophica bacterium]|nr:SPOR domain-containing protein [Candidatus Omnitrophota bacterium]